MKKIDQLTVTRFIAALSVVLYHSGGVFPFDRSPLSELFASGPIAVNYFFALSGFVMSLAYYRGGRKLKTGDYYLARFSRVYPVYLLSFLLACLHYADSIAKIRSEKILANLFLVQAWIPDYALSFNYVAWSLSVEALFYAVFPFLTPLFSRLSVRKLIWGTAAFWGASILFHTALFEISQGQYDYVLYYNPLLYLNVFVLGGAAGVWYLQADKERVSQSVVSFLLLGGTGLLALILIFQEQFIRTPALVTWTTGLLTPLFVLVILALALETGFVSRVLSHKWLVFLGDISYAMFILNIPARWMAQRAVTALELQLSTHVFNYIYIPVLILLSAFTYLKFERPARAWLLANRQMLYLFALDIIFTGLAVWLAYLLRFSAGDYDFHWRLFVFSLRAAIPITMTLLLLFRLYQPSVLKASVVEIARSLVAPILLSGLFLFGAHYWAFQSRVISTFAKSFLALCVAALFCFTWVSRFLFLRWASRARASESSATFQ